MKSNILFYKVINVIWVINTINISLILGIMLTHLRINRYISLAIMLVSCIVLCVASSRIFKRYVLKNNKLPKSSILSIFILIFNLTVMAYYLYISDYITAIILFAFQLGCYFWFNKIGGKKNKSSSSRIKWRRNYENT